MSEQPKRKLSDILGGNASKGFAAAWDATQAAADFAPLPAGTYEAHVASGELSTARSGTPGYKLKFKVLGGDFAGRLLWHDLWLTDAALPRTKRDLLKLGIDKSEQLERPIPPGIRCSVRVTLRTCDDGVERNEVRSFEMLGVDPPERDTFAPDEPGKEAQP